MGPHEWHEHKEWYVDHGGLHDEWHKNDEIRFELEVNQTTASPPAAAPQTPQQTGQVARELINVAASINGIDLEKLKANPELADKVRAAITSTVLAKLPEAAKRDDVVCTLEQ